MDRPLLLMCINEPWPPMTMLLVHWVSFLEPLSVGPDHCREETSHKRCICQNSMTQPSQFCFRSMCVCVCVCVHIYIFKFLFSVHQFGLFFEGQFHKIPKHIHSLGLMHQNVKSACVNAFVRHPMTSAVNTAVVVCYMQIQSVHSL